MAYCTDAERRRMLDLAEREVEFVGKNSVCTSFFEDVAFPTRLAMCDDAPAMLYSLGSCNLNARHSVAIVGTRNATPYGSNITRHLVEDLSHALDSLIIVSGLAYGIDVQAHRAALQFGVPTVAVVAHGLQTIYPADHRDVASRMVRSGGAIVTEYLSSAPVHRGNFLARNRIVAGLCDALIVVESDNRGGALVTANLAGAYNREVCAVPGRATDRYSRGCNGLIATRRASMIRDAADLIDLMGWTPRPQEGEQGSFDFGELSPKFKVIVDHLRQHPDHTINDMAAALAIPFPTLSATIMEMELDDILVALPGGTFQLNI